MKYILQEKCYINAVDILNTRGLDGCCEIFSIMNDSSISHKVLNKIMEMGDLEFIKPVRRIYLKQLEKLSVEYMDKRIEIISENVMPFVESEIGINLAMNTLYVNSHYVDSARIAIIRVHNFENDQLSYFYINDGLKGLYFLVKDLNKKSHPYFT